MCRLLFDLFDTFFLKPWGWRNMSTAIIQMTQIYKICFELNCVFLRKQQLLLEQNTIRNPLFVSNVLLLQRPN